MKTRTAIPVILALALALAACAGDPTSSGEGTASSTTTTPATTTPTTSPTTTSMPDADDELAALEAAEALWASSGIVTYSYVYRQSCECDVGASGPNTVIVTDGQVVEVRMNRRFEPGFDPNAVAPPGNTVPGLFSLIRDSIAAGHQIDVTYDPRLGHPLRVRLDLEAIPADGGFDFELQSFDAQEEARSALADARALWESSAPAEYTFVYRPQCFCVPSAIEVTVVGGEIQSHEALEGELYGEVLSIDDIFAYIEDSLDQHPFAIDVEYDATLGYPTAVFVDFDEMIADEEFGYSVELTAGA
jgi:hypothetical protein